MPAVRMIRVCPMASVPTTITCCTISDRFPPVRNALDLKLKNVIARTRKISGPTVGVARKRAASLGPLGVGGAPGGDMVAVEDIDLLQERRSIWWPVDRPVDGPGGWARWV